MGRPMDGFDGWGCWERTRRERKWAREGGGLRSGGESGED